MPSGAQQSVAETGELGAAQPALVRTTSLWKAMDSAGFIAFHDENMALVCYGDLALTFGRIPEDWRSRLSRP